MTRAHIAQAIPSMFSGSASDEYWCPAESVGTPAEVMISGDEWLALLKIAHGDWSIRSGDLACLLERKLVEISSGVVRLTPDGCVALGLPV